MERDSSAEYKKRPITDMERSVLAQKTQDLCARYGNIVQVTPLSPLSLQAHFAVDGSYITITAPAEQTLPNMIPDDVAITPPSAPRAFIEVATPLGGADHQYWTVEKYATTSDLTSMPSYSEQLYSEESNENGAWTHYVPPYVYAAINGDGPAVFSLSKEDRARIQERTVLTRERYETVMARIEKLQAAHLQPEISEIIRRSNEGGLVTRPTYT